MKMGKNYDEPMFIDVKKGTEKNGSAEGGIVEGIRSLCEEQSFAVLSTQGMGQPYASLIGFAISEDLRHVVFMTPRQTRKYSLIEGDRKVSLLVDNRSHQPDSLNQISAVTITGNATIISDKDEMEKWSILFLEKHPYLTSFVKSSSTAMVLVEVSRYFYVRRFQEVFEWSPSQNS
jgi:heme iron utilization protein